MFILKQINSTDKMEELDNNIQSFLEFDEKSSHKIIKNIQFYKIIEEDDYYIIYYQLAMKDLEQEKLQSSASQDFQENYNNCQRHQFRTHTNTIFFTTQRIVTCLIIIIVVSIYMIHSYSATKLRKQQEIQKQKQRLIQSMLNDHYIQIKAESILNIAMSSCKYGSNLKQRGFNITCQDIQQISLQEINNNQVDYDWIQCFQIGEQISQQQISTLVDTLTEHALRGIIMSWADKGQDGVKDRKDKIKMIESNGFDYQPELSQQYRSRFELNAYFNQQIMVFLRRSGQLLGEGRTYSESGQYYKKEQIESALSFSQTGAWQGTGQAFKQNHNLNPILGKVLQQHYKNFKAKSIVDFGGGLCSYAQNLQRKGFKVQCYDGNKFVQKNTKIGKYMDLSQNQNLGKFDWVQSFQVGQHIPSKYQDRYIETITKHASQGIIMSWAHKGQTGNSHVNNKNKQEVIRLIQQKNFKYQKGLSEAYRQKFGKESYFHKNLLVFFRQKSSISQKKDQNKNQDQNKMQFSENGAWQGTGKDLKENHIFQPVLQDILYQNYQKYQASSIVDFGGGLCQYAQNLQQKGYKVECYDGNKFVADITKFGKYLDLSKEQNLPQKFDWVQCFQVGQHIPQKYTNTFVDTLTKHALKGIIMSWAHKGQGGAQHINTKDRKEVIALIEPRGFQYQPKLSRQYRSRFEAKTYFNQNIVVFLRRSQQSLEKGKMYQEYEDYEEEIERDITFSQTGAWQGKGQGFKRKYRFFPKLQKILEQHYKKYQAKSIADFGGGLCRYAQYLIIKKFKVSCYDGNKQIRQNTKIGQYMDLAQENDLGQQFDWVQSIQVGQHIPIKYQEAYINNIAKHASKGIIISWAHKGQVGKQIVNTKQRQEVIQLFQAKGFRYQKQLSENYRSRFKEQQYIKQNLMVFFKGKKI